MCFSPILVKSPNGEGLKTVPCGHCLQCLQEYQQFWACRIDNEIKAWDSAIFFTLTYSDDSLPLLVSGFRGLSFSQTVVRGLEFDRLSPTPFLFSRSLKDDTRSFRLERKCLCDSYLDMGDDAPPIACPTVLYDDVREWIKYCRKWYDRHHDFDVFQGRKVSQSLKDRFWVDKDGNKFAYPDSAYSKSFKYFITSEYGPRTLRPHYHGVLFGVSEEDFRNVFAPWWRNHFGGCFERSVKFSKFDPSKGGALYIAKYCSKGSFEHPLCSRVVRFKSGRSFNARSYYNCVDWFGVDAPFCMPTFHLVSKGIGVRYSFNASVQYYWHVSCSPLTDWISEDSDIHYLSLDSAAKLSRLSTLNTCFVDGSLGFENTIARFAGSDKLKPLSVSRCFVLPCEEKDDRFDIECLTKYNLKYVRRYIYQGEAKVFTSSLPRYYRRWLLSPFAQIANEYIQIKLHEADFDRKREEIESQRSPDEKDALIRSFTRSDVLRQMDSAKDYEKRYCEFYGRIFKGDM